VFLGAQLHVVHGFDSPTSELVAKVARFHGEASDVAGTSSSSFIYDASIGQITRNLFRRRPGKARGEEQAD